MATTGSENHACILIILMKGGTIITKRLFEKRVVELTPKDHGHLPWTVDEFLLANKNKLLKTKAGRDKEKMYFPGVCDTANLNLWDLNMFCHVILELADVNPVVRMDVKELRKIRNKLCHLNEPNLDDKKYRNYLEKFNVIFDRLLKEIGDETLETEIKDMVQTTKQGPLSRVDTWIQLNKFYMMDMETKEILSGHTKDHQQMLDKMDIIIEQTKPAGDAAIELPDTDVEIVVKNCNTDKEKHLSELLVKLIDENINKHTTLSVELSTESYLKLREAVGLAVETFLSNGRQIISTEKKCILLRIRCCSLKSLVNLFRDCVSGNLNQQLKPLEAAVKQIPEYKEVSLEAVIYEDEFWKVMGRTVSAIDAYVASRKRKSTVTLEQTRSSSGSFHIVKLSIPTESAGHSEQLKTSFESGSVKLLTNSIQEAACKELNLTDVSIEARLIEDESEKGRKHKYIGQRDSKSNISEHVSESMKNTISPNSEYIPDKLIKVPHEQTSGNKKTMGQLTDIDLKRNILQKNVHVGISDVTIKESIEKDYLLVETEEIKHFSRASKDDSLSNFSSSADSGVDTDISSHSSSDDMHLGTQIQEEVLTISSDDRPSDCSYTSDGSEVENFSTDMLNRSVKMSEPACSTENQILEKRSKTQRGEEGRDEYLIQHGIKLNESFLTNYRSKTAKYPAFYQKFRTHEELKRLILSNPRKYIQGVIHVQGSHEAYCNLTTKAAGENLSRIEISGRSKIGQAYNEDEVVIELLDNKNKHETRFGQVIGVLKRHRCKNENIKHPVFLCTPDDAESHIVRPLCKTIPKIHVMHDAIKQKYKTKKAMRFKVEIYEYDEHAEILCNPRIETLSYAEFQSCVFLVAIISWELNQIYPRGAIIKRFPCGESIDSGLAILNLRYGITKMFSKETDQELEQLEESISRNDCDTTAYIDEEIIQDKSALRTFTIDRRDAKDLNMAFSVEEYNDGFKVGVHIVDVSVYIKKDSPIDKDAYNRALTINSEIDTARYMLPEQIAVGLCSLLQNEKRPVISIYIFLSKSGKYTQTTSKNYLIETSFIRCCRNFSYEEAQQVVMDGNDDDITRDVTSLFRLMKSARKIRLGRSSRILSSCEIQQEEYGKTSTEAHCVAEELAIMVNKKVAEIMLRNKITIPVYTQQPPSIKELECFCQKYGSYMDVLVHFQNRQLSPSRRPMLENALKADTQQQIMLIDSIWANISRSFSPTVVDSILEDTLHPLQSVIYMNWLSIKKNSYYKCSATELEDKRHYSLDFDVYTHCTSPTRRYTDIVVQRMLHFYLQRNHVPYCNSEIEEICVHVNFVTGNSIGYQTDCISLQRALQLKSRVEMHRCFVHDISDQSIKVKTQSKAILCGQDAEISFNLLDMGYKPEKTIDSITKWDTVTGKWRKRLYDLGIEMTGAGLIGTGNKYQQPESENKANKYFEQLNPFKGVKLIKIQQWARLVKNAADNHLDDLKRNIKRAAVQKKENGVSDVSTECFEPSKMQANTKFSLKFHIGQLVNIQMHAKPTNGIITPQPMLFQMTDNLKLCLQHTDDPVFHLSKYSTRSAIDQYRSCEEYTNIWLPIVLMESSVSAVCNEDGCTINNVQVNIENERQGMLMLPVDFCEERNINFSGSLGTQEEGEQCNSYDWLCIKSKAIPTVNQQKEGSEIDPMTYVWVGHAEVSEVTLQKTVKKGEPESMYLISFNLHESSGIFHIEKKERNQINCSIEILRKTDVDRRIESNLKALHSKTDVLAVQIALKRKLEPLDESHLQQANIIERDLYFSTICTDSRSKPLPRNNHKQQEAIDLALRNRFTLIQGPPGTGKTYTGIKLIYLFNKINATLQKKGNPKKQVLFCGPSNKSVDLVAKWMLRRLGNYCPDFVRIYGRATETEDFPIPGLTYQSKGNKIHRADEELRPVTLHYLIRSKSNELSRKIIAKDEKFKEYQEKHLKPSAEEVKRYISLLARASMTEIEKHQVLLCTTSFASNPKLLKASNVFQVIVDEAGMCPEPQCMVPLIATSAEQIVMIGDHKQLRPIVTCKAAAELGLDKSLFERYATTKDRIGPFIMLNQQYRMHPQLCEFPSTQFYKGNLKTELGLWEGDILDIWPIDATGFTTYPHILIHVEGEESVLTVNTDDGHEQSRSNSREIDKVINVYRYLMEENIPPFSVNIISQYNAQCSEIKDGMKKQGFTNYVVNTVVSSQGGEWDYVIFSTVRSLPEYKIETNSTIGWRKHNLGFITDINQINVALTRARKGLVIIGNKNLLSCDPVWKKLISHYEQRKCVKFPHEFPPPRTRQQRIEKAMKRSSQRFGNAPPQTKTTESSASFASMGAIPKTRSTIKKSTHTVKKAKSISTNKAFILDPDEWPCLPQEHISFYTEIPIISVDDTTPFPSDSSYNDNRDGEADPLKYDKWVTVSRRKGKPKSH